MGGWGAIRELFTSIVDALSRVSDVFVFLTKFTRRPSRVLLLQTRIWMQQVKEKDVAKKRVAPVTNSIAAAATATSTSPATPPATTTATATATATSTSTANENKASPAACLDGAENNNDRGVQHVGVEGGPQQLSFLALGPSSAALDLKDQSRCEGGSDRCGGTVGGGSSSSRSNNGIIGGSSSGGNSSGNSSGRGRETSKTEFFSTFGMPWAAGDVVVGGNVRRSRTSGTATPTDNAKSHHHRQPSQQQQQQQHHHHHHHHNQYQHQHQQHKQQPASYSDMFQDFDIGGIADRKDAQTPQQQHQHRQLQQAPEPPASYPDLLEGSCGGGVADGMVGTNPHSHSHHHNHHQEPSHPDLSQGFDFFSLA